MGMGKLSSLAALGHTFDRGIKLATGSRDAWLKGTFQAAAALAKARKRFAADRDFHAWLRKRKSRLSKDDRAALIQIGGHIRQARRYFQRKQSWSWRACADWLQIEEGLARRQVSQPAKLAIEYARPATPLPVRIAIQHRKPELRLVSLPDPDPIFDQADLQRAISAAREVFEVSKFSTQAVASYWKANNRPTSAEIREAAVWLDRLAIEIEARATTERIEPRVAIFCGELEMWHEIPPVWT